MSEPLILGPYKEPLKPVQDGYGYLGALTFNTAGQIQCHICGKLYDNLSFHIRGHKVGKRKMNSKEYKEKFHLMRGARLISEKFRAQMKERGMRLYASYSPEQRKEWQKRATRNALGKSFRRLSLEEKNIRGICPDQLLSLIRSAAQAMGAHTK